MLLSEAIEHCEEKSKHLRCEADLLKDSETKADCLECAGEHEQLAKWLKELKAFRKAVTLGELISASGIDKESLLRRISGGDYEK